MVVLMEKGLSKGPAPAFQPEDTWVQCSHVLHRLHIHPCPSGGEKRRQEPVNEHLPSLVIQMGSSEWRLGDSLQ